MNVSFYITIIWRHLLIDILLLLYMGPASSYGPVIETAACLGKNLERPKHRLDPWPLILSG